MLIYNQKDIKRFWSKISFPTNENDCWILNTSVDKDGYSWFHLNHKMIKGHIFNYVIHFGQVPENMCVCHSCDVRNCVNPKHLFIATHQDNISDRVKKGRTHKHIGVLNGRSKLDENLVRQIRNDLITDTILNVANKYGMGTTTIINIKHGRTWKHVN